MNISIIGTGYVGLVTGACLAELGLDVICVDKSLDKINALKNGIMPIYEKGLESVVKRNYSEGRLKFDINLKEAVESSQAIFLTVGTPEKENGSADLQYVFQAVKEIANYMDDYKVIIDKSTVPVGTGQIVKKEIDVVLRYLNKKVSFDVVSNPEFLREGFAVKDFMNPDRIVIGVETEQAENTMREIYESLITLGIPLFVTNIETAEMIKYASNAFLATKVSFINEIANLCELCSADVMVVAKAMGMDNRIGYNFLNPGPGFGGSCFPKDTKALIKLGETVGYIPRIVNTVIEVNENQKRIAVNKIVKALNAVSGKTVSILGLAFKAGTDDIRESPAIFIIKELLMMKVHIKAYDPFAMNNMKRLHPKLEIDFCNNSYDACSESDCIVILTEWDEFNNLSFEKLKSLVRSPSIVDLRNICNVDYVSSIGFKYDGIGRGFITQK